MTPDDDVFKHLALVYAKNHPTMGTTTCDSHGLACNPRDQSCNGPHFKDGITNGANWYSFSGGMQDYNYAFHGCMEITLEISCCKYPKASLLESFWKENQKVSTINHLI